MPTIFFYHGYRFFFYSNEGSPREPIHIHVRRESAVAKYAIEPTIKLINSYGFTSKELNKIKTIVQNRRDEIVSAWNEFFS